jgi:hypothetical protein
VYEKKREVKKREASRNVLETKAVKVAKRQARQETQPTPVAQKEPAVTRRHHVNHANTHTRSIRKSLIQRHTKGGIPYIRMDHHAERNKNKRGNKLTKSDRWLGH